MAETISASSSPTARAETPAATVPDGNSLFLSGNLRKTTG